jgi:hypothetical protein
MPITDAPDGTLWVQEVIVDVDVPAPPTEEDNELLTSIDTRIAALVTLLTLVAGWDFDTLQTDVAAVKPDIATIAAWAFDTLQSDIASLEDYLVPATQEASGAAGRYSGTDTSYQTVASWTVETGKTGELKEITLLSDDYDHTEFKITVGGIVFANDWQVQAAVPLIFEDLRLAAGSIVKVEAQSTDGTAIVVDAVITGKEIT